MLRDYSLQPTEVPVHTPAFLPDVRRSALKSDIKRLLVERDAVLVAHYYVDGDIQDLADETGGCVADSLEMARFGRDHPANTLIVAGVRFMGETAKILSPEKRVFMPTLEAECSLDLGCPPDEFKAFCDENPDRTVVVYANTSVAVKALADWVVTSSVGLKIVEHLAGKGEKILWAPDKHLGNFIRSKTGADMLLWSGACVVHEEFKFKALEDVKRVYPDAGVLVHPESPAAVIDIADRVGSDEPDHSGRPGTPPRHLHRGHGPRHLPQAAQVRAGQAFHRSPHGGRRRHVPQLRALSVDGHERTRSPGGHPGKRRQRDSRRTGGSAHGRWCPCKGCWRSRRGRPCGVPPS